jgi:enamine deaminase RidA (YjgF/YER057c/UK114 family)
MNREGMMSVDRIQPQGLSQPAGSNGQPSYSHVVKAGNTVYIAGQVARNAQGELVGKGDIEAQITQVFENLKMAMASVGGDLSNLVKVVIYLTDPRFREAYRSVQPRYLQGSLPVSTMLIVKGLALPEYMVEIDAIAVVD